MPVIERLRKRKDFLRISSQGRKVITENFILLAMAMPENETISDVARFGFTVTKKMGNAPQRNRIRRRLREAVRAQAPATAQAGWDYVLIARNNALQCAFSTLLREVSHAVPRVPAAAKNTPRPRRQKNQGQKLTKEIPRCGPSS